VSEAASLHDRLRRLRRTTDDTATGPEGGGLEALETSLLGGTEDGLTLKQRLERLVAVASRAAALRERASAPRPVALEELIQGRRVENERGEFFVVETDLHLDGRHGDLSLSRFRTLAPGSVGVLTGERELDGFDLGRAVFLDTETTGLAGGTGTAAFLVGVAFLDGDRFRVRQYFMRDYPEEAAMLRGLAEDLRGFKHLVTYNGRTFDAPLLEARYRLNREPYPLADWAHLDLLHPARRLWKERLESCRLQFLESELLGVHRYGDVPGADIPRIYFDYVRSRGRDARALVGVLEHNRVDVLSLAALAVLACEWVQEARAEDPRDVYCLGRVFERAEMYERSDEQYRRVVTGDGGDGVRVPSLLRLAARAKRTGDHRAAASFWEEAAQAGDCRALRELAVFHEHRTRDLVAALLAVDRALDRLNGWEHRRAATDFRRRRERIRTKLEREQAGR
jgi:uncharacterized protein YprB with RNaseH-like and TPR domain